jgi:multidrug efflux system outer membrane protein
MRLASALAAALLLPGCLMTVGPEPAAPTLDAPPAYRGADALAPVTGAAAHAAWWRGFDDPVLTDLVEQALASNLDIAAAQARLEEAHALAGGSRADLWPTLDAGAGMSGRDELRRWQTPTSNRGASGGASGNNDLTGTAEAGLTLGWTPDLFGGGRRALQAAEAEALRRELLRDDLRRQVAAEVVARYLDIARDRATLAVIDAALDVQGQTLALVRRRYAAGLAAALDVSRAETQEASTRARRGPLLQSLAEAEAALAVLSGRAGSFTAAPPAPTAIPAHTGGPDLGLPRDLLRARPDVRAAEAALVAALAEIGVAEAALYPSLSLPGSLTLTSAGLGTASVVTTLVGTLAASLDLPLFDAGARRADISAAEARAREALIDYRAALLDAVADVETALGALAGARGRVGPLQDAVTAGEAAVAQSRDLYAQGLVGFLDVLDAERALLDNRQALQDARADMARAIAALYTAVGAGSVS